MRKYLQISFFLGLFGFLVLVKHAIGSDTPVRQVGSLQTPLPLPTPTPVPTSTPPQTVSSSSAPVKTAQPTPMQMMKRMGQYKDGTYTGSVQDAYYGNIQVQAVISGGRITNVVFLQYPNDNGTSQYINSQADPMLTQEAIQAQNANVDIVSGASASSQAFQSSLADALSQAK